MTKWRYGYENDDRDRGAISPSDREFLYTGGDNLKNERTRRNTARRVRQRVQDTIIDFDILCRLLDNEGDIQKIFEPTGDDVRDARFRAGMKSMVEFLHRGLDISDTDIDFETVLESGVHDAVVRKKGGPTTIRVDFNVDTTSDFDLERAKERYENDDALTVSEIGALLALGVVDEPDEIEELAEHARGSATFPASMSPMLSQFLEERTESGPFDGTYVPVTDDDAKDLGRMTDIMTRSETLPMVLAMQEKADFGGDDDADDGGGEEGG